MITSTASVRVETTGNLVHNDAQVLGIDKDGMSMVLSLLSNMYSDASLAVVREYSCNARDSHVEAGNPDPIQVTLPSRLVPQFKVQDYGVGLSKNEILNVFAQYGASTKRNSNNQIGAFGIGAKSAFTVGTQFIVTGVKDGDKTVALFSLNAKGDPTVEVLVEDITTEPNGVLVEVGVNDIDGVRRAAERLFQAWPKGSVLVDGKAPESIWEHTEAVVPNRAYLSFYEEITYPGLNVLMGGVPYPIPHAVTRLLSHKVQSFLNSAYNSRVRYYIDVPIGGVEITPSREELRNTAQTVSTLDRMVTELIDAMPAWVSKRLNAAPNMWEATKIFRDLSLKLNFETKGLKWRGVDFGKHNMQLVFKSFYVYKKSNHGTVKHIGVNDTLSISLLSEKMGQMLFVTEVPDDKHNTARRYARIMISEKNYSHIVITSEKNYTEGWFSFGKGTDSDLPTMTYDEYRVEGRRLQKEAAALRPGGARSSTTYEVSGVDEEDQYLTAEEIEELDEEVVLVGIGQNHYTHDAIGRAALKDRIVVRLDGRKSADTFCKRVTQVVDVYDVYKKHANEWVSKITQADRDLIAASQILGTVNHQALRFVKQHISEITNKTLLQYVDQISAKQNLTQKEEKRLGDLRMYLSAVGKPVMNDSTSHVDLFDKLPLLEMYLRTGDYYISGRDKKDLARKQVIDLINHTAV